MNPDSMDIKSIMFLPNSTIATGQLCPDQRRMPQIVSSTFFTDFICHSQKETNSPHPTGILVRGDVCNVDISHSPPSDHRGISPGHAGSLNWSVFSRQQKPQPAHELWARDIQSGGIL